MIRTQLEAVGLKIKPTADQWDPDYLEKIQGTDNHGIHLLGWTGDYNDTDNFLGVFFGTATAEWGFNNQQLFDDLKQARGLPTVEEQTPVYEKINQEVMDFLPGVPAGAPGAVPGVLTGRQGLPAQPRPGRGLEHHLARLTCPFGGPLDNVRKAADAALRAATTRPDGAGAGRALAAAVRLGPGAARRPGAGTAGGAGHPGGAGPGQRGLRLRPAVAAAVLHLRQGAAARRLRLLHPDRSAGRGQLPGAVPRHHRAGPGGPAARGGGRDPARATSPPGTRGGCWTPPWCPGPCWAWSPRCSSSRSCSSSSSPTSCTGCRPRCARTPASTPPTSRTSTSWTGS